nr:MAG TPA: hypothetical protein [Bacteriophage sp.]
MICRLFISIGSTLSFKMCRKNFLQIKSEVTTSNL